MNNQRRKDLTKAIELIEEAKSIVNAAEEEEQEFFDNMPEGLQASERGERAEEAAQSLEEMRDNFYDAIELIEKAMS